jgi:hypothetical protein
MIDKLENDIELYVENRSFTSTEEAALLQHIEAYKAQKLNNSIIRLLQNGKLTVEEIAVCLEIPTFYILQIQNRLVAA